MIPVFNNKEGRGTDYRKIDILMLNGASPIQPHQGTAAGKIKKMTTAMLLLLLCLSVQSQTITYSDYNKEDNRDINFDVLGKMGSQYLVYKNVRWKHGIDVFDNDMKLKEKVPMEFISDKTFNVDFVVYPQSALMIYQYQRKGTIYCNAVKIGPDGHAAGEPVQLDTTYIGVLSDNKIYSVVASEDKQQIMLFKIPQRNFNYSIVTMLYDSSLQLKHKTRLPLDFDRRRDVYGDFLVDNDGNFAFTKATKKYNREDFVKLELITKAPQSDSLVSHAIDLEENYLDELRLKADNLNKRYLLHSFYMTRSRGAIEGLFTAIWNRQTDSFSTRSFTEFSEQLRQQVKADGNNIRFAFDNFFIRNVIIKKDGGFLLMAEDFSSQSRINANPWNRWDYLFSPYGNYNSLYYSYYSPYNYYYRPWSSTNNNSVRYYYDNIMILSFDKDAQLQWNNVVMKEQVDDDTDNYLSFGTVNAGGEIYYLYNDNRRFEILANAAINPKGEINRKPTLKSLEKGYMFMPRLAKQTGFKQIIMPCSYRSYICFAKIDFP